MKKLTKLLICTLICLMTFSIMAASAQNINVTINGQLQEYSTPLVSIDNRILAPVRAIFEELDATVRWDGATRTVFAYKENTVITIPIDSKIVTIQDEKSKKEIKLDVPAQIVNSGTYVPVRFVGEALGAEVKWDGTTSTVIINYEIKRQKKRIDYDNGSYYEGEVIDGTLDGYGVLYYINGDKYEGDWKNDLMNGQGTYTWKDGSYYVGTWKDGKYLVGTVTNVDGTTVEYDYSDKDSKDKTATESINLSNNQLAESYIKILKPLVEQMTNQGVTIPIETEAVLKDKAEGFFGTNREALENLAIEAPQSQMIKNISDYNGTIINEKHRVIAIISDMHGNIPALEVVLNDIKSRNIKKVYCLGDLAGKGPSSAEAVDSIRTHCEVVVKGNWDYYITEQKDSKILMWHQDRLGSERLCYMKELPIYIEFYMSGKLIRLCHASPNDLFHRVHLSTAIEERLKLFMPTKTLNKEADVVGYGDIHGAHIDNFKGKTIFNAGSVGNPLEITQASYAIIEGKYGSKENSPFTISLVRVPYNIELAINHAMKSDMPDKQEYINELKTAVYRGRKK